MTEHFSRLFCFLYLSRRLSKWHKCCFAPLSFRAEDRNGMMRAVHGDSEEEPRKFLYPLRRAPFGREISPLPFAAVEMTVWRDGRAVIQGMGFQDFEYNSEMTEDCLAPMSSRAGLHVVMGSWCFLSCLDSESRNLLPHCGAYHWGVRFLHSASLRSK